MGVRFLLLLATVFSCTSCTGKKIYGEENPDLYIKRFDVDFYQYLQGEAHENVLDEYSDFLQVYGGNVLNVGTPDQPDFYEKLRAYFSNLAIWDLYQTQQQAFSDVALYSAELSKGLDGFLNAFPSIPKPKVYMHVSGWEQKIVVTDSILSLSADFYLGSDYPYYQNFFYDYQRKLMNPDRIVPDYLMGFMIANLPFEGREDVLLDRMLYEGKLAYMLSCFLPDRRDWEYVAYSSSEYDWCESNQAQIWKTLLENQHLFAPDLKITSQYLKEAPHTAFLPEQSPGRVGVWIGYRIISAYMDRNSGLSFSELMAKTDYQEILKESKYKP